MGSLVPKAPKVDTSEADAARKKAEEEAARLKEQRLTEQTDQIAANKRARLSRSNRLDISLLPPGQEYGV